MQFATFLSTFVTVLGVVDLQASQNQITPETSVQGSRLAGHWIANIPKSKLHPSFRYDSVTLQIAVTRDTVTMATEIVIGDKTLRAAETFRTDGTQTPGTLNPGIVLMARWVGSHVLASVAEKNNQVVALVTDEVSADGKTLTSRRSGMIEQIIVFDRNGRDESIGLPAGMFPR